MARATKLQTAKSKLAMYEALEKTLGNVTSACKLTGISRMQYYNWMNTDAAFRKQVEEIEHVSLDFAESKLMSKIKDGNIQAIIFFLKTRGKSRGYVERTESAFVGDAVITVNIGNGGNKH